MLTQFNYCINLDPELFCACRGENLRAHFQTRKHWGRECYCIRNRGSGDSCGLGSRSIRSTHTEARKHSFSLVSYMRPWRSFQRGSNHFFNPFLSNDCFKSNLVPRALFSGFTAREKAALNPTALFCIILMLNCFYFQFASS